jgi:predicted DNA-binding transcriptional regulator AlpA
VTDRLLTARELGEYLGLSTNTILDRFERGDLPGFRLFGRKGGPVRFRLSEIESQLDGWRFGAGPTSQFEIACARKEGERRCNDLARDTEGVSFDADRS